ncbi:MAG: hypothetical protein KC912_23760 [Proteobacteria bacterium]|nr:hypothetical protein [Pseudomonadota bacterium]
MSNPKRTRAPAPVTLAEAFYGECFDVRSESERDEAAGDWFGSSAADQRYVLGHLLYLNLLALEGLRRVGIDLRDQADDFGTMLETELEEARAETAASDVQDIPELPSDAIEPVDAPDKLSPRAK